MIAKLVENLLDRYGDAKTQRGECAATLEEVGKYVWPPMQDMIRVVDTEEGQVRTVNIADVTAITACERMTSGIMSHLMPGGSRWFEFVARDDKLNDDPGIKLWLSKATIAVHNVLQNSNFDGEMYATIRGICSFGTGGISVEKIGKEINFQSYHLGDMFFEINSKGIIDVVFRKIRYTVRQARQEFKGGLGKTVMDELKNNKASSKKFEFVHCCYPNEDYSGKMGSWKFRSVYINIEDKVEVKKKDGIAGFKSIPYFISRFAVVPGEILGRGPGIDGLPEFKMANRMKMAFIEGSELQFHPPTVVEDDGVVGQPVTSPGGFVVVRAGAKYPEALKTGVNAALGDVIIKEQQTLIKNDIFYNDLFDALRDYHNMTAYEVAQRVDSKLVFLGPHIIVQKHTLINRIVFRILDLLDEEQLEKRPEKLDLDIIYQGRLALAMKNMQTSATESTLALWQPYQEIYPVYDNMKMDESFRESALAKGVPAERLRDPDEVKSIREERNAPLQAAQDAEIAETGSKALKNLSGDVKADSILRTVG